MLDDTTASWWYEQDGQQAGPATAAALARLVAEGRLGPGHRVWRDGMRDWEALGSVAELAEALQASRPPGPPRLSPPAPSFGRPHGPSAPPGPPGAGAGSFGGGSGAGWGGPAAAPVSAVEEISPGAVLILSIVTLGIYGLVKFHQTGKGYEALAGRSSDFARDFWLFVGLAVASGFVVWQPVIGGPLSIASLVFGVLALGEALALRDEVIARAGIRPEVTGAGTHKVLYVLGFLLSPVLVGLVLLLVQTWRWFSDWNAVGVALARGPAAGPAPGR